MTKKQLKEHKAGNQFRRACILSMPYRTKKIHRGLGMEYSGNTEGRKQ